MVFTENFNPDSDPKLLCTCGHEDCDQRSVNLFTLTQVQFIREDLNQSMTVNSGGRCPNHPNEVHKTKAGDHQRGYGIDIACDNIQLETKLKVLAGRYGATRVAGTHKDGFIHLAWTPTDRKDVPTWEY